MKYCSILHSKSASNLRFKFHKQKEFLKNPREINVFRLKRCAHPDYTLVHIAIAFPQEFNDVFIKLSSENKPIICAFGNLHYQISREKFEPEPGFELHPCFKGRV